jgi:hypothetical protein
MESFLKTASDRLFDLSKRYEWLLLGLLIALAVCLRLPNFNESLWLDEVLSSRVGLANPLDFWRTVIFENHPIFYRILMLGWIRLFGDSEISLRLPSLLFGSGSIILLYQLGKKWTGRKMAFLAALLLTLSPVHIWYSQEAKLYSLLLFLVLSSVYLFGELENPKRKAGWLLYSLSIFLMVFTHYSSLIFILAIWTLALFGSKRTFLKISAVHILVLGILALSVYLQLFIRPAAEGIWYLNPFKLFEWWKVFSCWFSTGYILTLESPAEFVTLIERPFFALSLLLVYFFWIRGLLGFFEKPHRRLGFSMLLYLFALPAAFFTATKLGLQHIYIERGLYPVLPFFFLCLAEGIVWKRKNSAVLLQTIFIIILCSAVLFQYFKRQDEWTVYKPNPDWRRASLYLKSEYGKRQAPLRVIISPNAMGLALSYYDPRFKPYLFENKRGAKFREMLSGIEKIEKKFPIGSRISDYFKKLRNEELRDSRDQKNGFTYYDWYDVPPDLYWGDISVFYLIWNHYWYVEDAFAKLQRNIEEKGRYRLTGQQDFKGLTVYKYES